MIMASHWVGLTFPGMIELPGSFSGSINSPSPERGPEPSQRMSSAIFARLAANVLHRTVGEDQRVVRREGGEVVRRRDEGLAGECRDGDAPRARRTRGGY